MACYSAGVTQAEDHRAWFWGWAVGVYGREEVRAACLALQDEGGADVPLLLWAAWLGAHGRVPDASLAAQAEALSARWRAAAVHPLRALRRGLRGGVEGLDPAGVEAARQGIAKAEQGAERQQMHALADLAAPPARGAARTHEALAAVARAAGWSLPPGPLAVLARAAS